MRRFDCLRAWGWVAGIAVVSLVSGCAGAGRDRQSLSPGALHAGSSGAPLRMGVIPYEDPQQEQEQYQPFGAYIGMQVNGQPASVFVASDYVGVVTALENSQVDIAYLNPLSYAIAAARAEKAGKPLIPIAMPYVIPPGQKKGSLTYEGIIFTRVDSGIHSLKDLKGKTFAFNEPTSTSGYLYPAALFLKAGINPKPMSEGGDLKDAHFAGAQGVVPSVLNGQSDAGAIYDEGIDISLPNPADRAKLRVIARTDPIPNGMLVARADMPHAEVVKLQKAFQTINTDPAGKASLVKMDVSKWVPAEDWLFNPVRKTAAILGLKLPAAKRS